MAVSPTFLFLLTLKALRSTSQVVCRISYYWRVFLLLKLGLWVTGMKTKRWSIIFITPYQVYMLSAWFVNVEGGLDHSSEVVFIRFLHSKVSIFLPFTTVHFWRESLCLDHALKAGSCVSLLEGSVYTYITWNYSTWDTCNFSPFINLSIHLY